MSLLSFLGYGLLFCLVLMVSFYFVAIKLRFYSLVDVVWAYGIGGLILLYNTFSDGALANKLTAALMALTWSLRLGTHLAKRLRSHFPEEDGRYAQLREKWGFRQFFGFFIGQGVSQWIFALPFAFLIFDRTPTPTSLLTISWICFVIGIGGESLADAQLKNWKSSNSKIGSVCNVGLWRLSRHPNYFFEFIIWCGISLAALNAPLGWVGLMSPSVMFVTLNYVTGIPPNEAQSIKKRGEEFKIYQQQTNRFFPWFPRHKVSNNS